MPLDRLQRWMQQVVVHPGTEEEAVADPGAQAELPRGRLEELILPSRALTPTQRVGIYHGMYLLRMEEALSADYPGLKRLLGEDAFFALVRGYVQEHPSRSFSLNRLGDHLPDYVRTAAGLKRRGFSHDLARLELAMSQVFDAPETPVLSGEAVAAVDPRAWETARLQPVAAFRLLSLRYPVSAYLGSLEGGDPPSARPRASWVAVHRRRYAVWRQDLTRRAYDLLADLVSGQTLGQALHAALRRPGRDRPHHDHLFGWFRQWTAGGFFQSVQLAP